MGGKSIIKLVLIVLVTQLLSVVLFLSFMLVSSMPPRQGFEEMRACFNRNQEAILVVRDYLLSRNEPFLRYDRHSRRGGGTMPTRDISLSAYTTFTSEEARDAMNLLLRMGYRFIEKENDFIVLERWGRGNVSIGIMYSANRSLPTVHTLPGVPITRLEYLSEEGWFYYEFDHNEFRRQMREEGRW
ncbi:MAG: hypothetical protein FWC69_02315 [Defluviitaleaceae bacterium]|nr:hypothetical protein [Defluviitaleaceae bacterium]